MAYKPALYGYLIIPALHYLKRITCCLEFNDQGTDPSVRFFLLGRSHALLKSSGLHVGTLGGGMKGKAHQQIQLWGRNL